MKTLIQNLILFSLMVCSLISSAQNITFGIANKTVTSTNVSFDVTLSSTSDFKLGSGQVYINYNSAAFGSSVVAGTRVSFSYPTGSVLAEQNILSVYSNFIFNDNTDSRFSFSWQQALAAGGITANNITATPAVLFRVTMDFVTGGNAQPDNLCFESSDIFDDQTFTACGPFSPGIAIASCASFPGSQLTGDAFNCTPAALPVELVFFEAWLNEEETVDLTWQTLTELNNDYFIVEHATDDQDFKEILRVQGAGTYQGVLDYKAVHERPAVGNNYYRLRQVDFDGSMTDSEIRQVSYDRPSAMQEVQVFPNPTYGPLTIRFSDAIDQGGQVRIFNNLGQFVRGYQIGKGLDQQSLNLSDLHKGVYLLEVQAGDQTISHKILLQ
ncbi:MAG: T9SS type A sorting domain-containing protein [Bacteroidota bacterium]